LLFAPVFHVLRSYFEDKVHQLLHHYIVYL